MTSTTEEIEKWWATMNIMSQAELYFKKALELRDKSSALYAPVKAMLLDGLSTRIIDRPEQLPKIKPHDLIVLQDLSREWVEALGPKLHIPVSVFALHWANPLDHVNGKIRVPIGESPARHFILNYRQSLPFSIQGRENDTIINGARKGQLGHMAASESRICS